MHSRIYRRVIQQRQESIFYSAIPHFTLYASSGAVKENLFQHQDLLLVISFILVALASDSGVILKEKLDSNHS